MHNRIGVCGISMGEGVSVELLIYLYKNSVIQGFWSRIHSWNTWNFELG